MEVHVIAVKNKKDVLKTADYFEQVGVLIFGSKESKNEFKDSDQDSKGFLMCNEKGEWRIQSHYIGFGITPKELLDRLKKGEAKLNGTILKIPKQKYTRKGVKKLFEKFQEDFFGLDVPPEKKEFCDNWIKENVN